MGGFIVNQCELASTFSHCGLTRRAAEGMQHTAPLPGTTVSAQQYDPQHRRTSRFEPCPISRHAPRRRQRRGDDVDKPWRSSEGHGAPRSDQPDISGHARHMPDPVVGQGPSRSSADRPAGRQVLAKAGCRFADLPPRRARGQQFSSGVDLGLASGDDARRRPVAGNRPGDGDEDQGITLSSAGSRGSVRLQSNAVRHGARRTDRLRWPSMARSNRSH